MSKTGINHPYKMTEVQIKLSVNHFSEEYRMDAMNNLALFSFAPKFRLEEQVL